MSPQRTTAPHSFAGNPLLALQHTLGNQAVQRLLRSGTLQTKLAISQPGDAYEQEADRVAEAVMRMPAPTLERACAPCAPGGPPCPKCEDEKQDLLQRKTDEGADTAAAAAPDDFVQRLGPGQPLGLATRSFFEPRLGYDFSQVRVHTGKKASESTQAVNALAYTVGRDIVFAAGTYSPGTIAGRHLLTHELAHVMQQTSSPEPRIQRFTAEQGEENRIFLRPEKGDTDADLDRVPCRAVKDRKIAKRERIDVTECFPRGTLKAMEPGASAFNCSLFVRLALKGGPLPEAKQDPRLWYPPVLWHELLESGHQITGFWFVDKQGKVSPNPAHKKLQWKQLEPRMGDLVFMAGNLSSRVAPKELKRTGEKMEVTWDHVGFFIVRSHQGFDYHLAKDGDENPIGVYHTGTELGAESYLTPGAYVKGATTPLAYLRSPEQWEETVSQAEVEKEEKIYISGEMSQLYWELPPGERVKVNAETDQRFQEETGITRKLDWNDPKDRPFARKWLRIRDEVIAKRIAGPKIK